MSYKSLVGQIEFDILSVSDTEALGEMAIQPGIMNPFGTIHAGALVWFADVIATNLVVGEEQVTEGGDSMPVAVTLNAQVLSNRCEGVVTARAFWLRRGPRVSTVRTLVTDESDQVLLDLTSTHQTGG